MLETALLNVIKENQVTEDAEGRGNGEDPGSEDESSWRLF
jgi:hypothetical protein